MDRVPEEDGATFGGRRPGDKLSEDGRRLAIGVAFMALLLVATLASAFLLGRPAAGASVAPGVPVLVLSGWSVVVASAVVFYRTYRGSGGG